MTTPSADREPTQPTDGFEAADTAEAVDALAANEGEALEAEREWWDDPGMPWKQKPGRADIACLSWFGVIAAFSLVLLPLRAWLMAASPAILAMISGSRSAVAASGALARVGEMPTWPIVFFIASLLSLKFDWVYWWAGRLWGRGMIEVWAGNSKRAEKRFHKAERWANKLGTLGMFVAYIPMPLPLMQVIFVVFGASGMSLKRFLVLDYIASTAWLAGYFALGWYIGEPAVAALEAYAKIAMWVALGLLVFVIFTSVMANKRRNEVKRG